VSDVHSGFLSIFLKHFEIDLKCIFLIIGASRPTSENAVELWRLGATGSVGLHRENVPELARGRVEYDGPYRAPVWHQRRAGEAVCKLPAAPSDSNPPRSRQRGRNKLEMSAAHDRCDGRRR
jgi:hypothetical protein